MIKKLSWIWGGINILVIVVVLNIILSNFPNLKIDLTKSKIHSLSPTTKNFIKNVDDIIQIKVYLTEDLPSEVKELKTGLKTILKDISNLNSKNIKVTYVDPNKDEAAKTEVQKEGIQPLQFSSVNSDKFQVQNGYFGLVMSYGDKKEVLPVAGDVGNLEYFVVSGIKKLITKESPVIAYCEQASNNVSATTILKKYLGDSYKIETVLLNGDSKLPESAKVLLIVGNTTEIDTKGQEKIKEWIKNGKGIIALLDKYEVDNTVKAKENIDTGLEKIFSENGMEIEKKIVSDNEGTITSFSTNNGSFLVKYQYWPQIRAENIDQSIPALSGLSSLNFMWASSIKVSDPAVKIISSSQHAQATEAKDLSPTVEQENSVGEKIAMGAINIKDGKKMALIADSDFIKDNFVVNNQQNLALVLNLVDYFNQDNSLMGIRSKSITSYPLVEVGDNLRVWIKVINIGLPLLLLIGTGVIINVYRKKK